MEYTTVTPDAACGYMGPNLHALKQSGVEIETVLDIGAAHGHFSRFLKHYWPDARVTAVECNERDRFFLDNTNWNVIYACLGDKECEKTFYINPRDEVGGGSSFHIENTVHFNDAEKETKKIVTLDSLNLGGFDLVKIDTQGSELEIIEGGLETIKNSRFLLIEASFLEYNNGGVLIDDLLAKTRELGFRLLDTFGPEYGGHWWNGRKIQVDVLLVKDGDAVLNMV